jgi:amidase
MARTVPDLRLMFEAMQGLDIGDPGASPVPVHWPSASELKKVRIGYFEDDGRTPVTPETQAAVRQEAEALRRHGLECAYRSLEVAGLVKFFGGGGIASGR